MPLDAGVGQVGPLAAAYVVVLAVLEPVLTRLADPVGDWLLPARADRETSASVHAGTEPYSTLLGVVAALDERPSAAT